MLDAIVPVTGVQLNKTAVSINEGESEKLEANVLPTNATDKSVKWESSNPSIVSVLDDGTIKALKVGTSKIIVTTNEGGKKAECMVTVSSNQLKGIQFKETELTIGVGYSKKLELLTIPEGLPVPDVVWESSSPYYATVSEDGIVTSLRVDMGAAVLLGGTVITATTLDGKYSAKCSVTTSAIKGWFPSEYDRQFYWYENGEKASGLSLIQGDYYYFDPSTKRMETGVIRINGDIYCFDSVTGKAVTGWYPSASRKHYYCQYGKTLKGFAILSDGYYYFDPTTHYMAVGEITINGIPYYYDPHTGKGLHNGWLTRDGKSYWYEKGQRQGLQGRGKEIYDPSSAAWYWLDSIQDGAKAVSKEVYQESSGGKWVRYDSEGHMVKGWYSNSNGTYYYNLITGAMTKGETTIDNIPCYFNTVTGVGYDGWRSSGSRNYWYEHGQRQGTKYDKNGVKGDGTVRGREIYDPVTKAWYWLDAVYDGAKAENKEVWMPYVYQNESPKTNGKWVRYNSNGGMIKGWYTTGTKKYYYDPTTGAMVKGPTTINGKKYWFGLESGILLHEYSS